MRSDKHWGQILEGFMDHGEDLGNHWCFNSVKMSEIAEVKPVGH